MNSTPKAIANVYEAMQLVEEAQNLLDRATQKLSPIRYGSDLMDKTYALKEKCHKHWYVLRKAAESRGRMSLDSEPEVLTKRDREMQRMAAEQRVADRIDGYDRDDLGDSGDR